MNIENASEISYKNVISITYAKSKVNPDNSKLYKEIKLKLDLEKIKDYKLLCKEGNSSINETSLFNKIALEIGLEILNSLDKNINK